MSYLVNSRIFVIGIFLAIDDDVVAGVVIIVDYGDGGDGDDGGNDNPHT